MTRLSLTTTIGDSTRIETLWAVGQHWRDPETGRMKRRAGYITRGMQRRHPEHIGSADWLPKVLPDPARGLLPRYPIGPVFTVKTAKEQHNAVVAAYVEGRRKALDAEVEALRLMETEERKTIE